MSVTQKFAIRKPFLIPLGLLLVQAFVLLAVVLFQGQPKAKAIILVMMMLPIAVLFVECLFRRTVIGDEAVTVYKFLRKKTLRFSDMTAVETVMVRKRAFLTLCAEDEFVILSNAYADFPELVNALLSRVPEQAISEETRQMAAAPPVKTADIVSCWLAVALLAFIIFIQFGGMG